VYDVFISYAREDSNFCEQLYDTLSAVFGLEVFCDTKRAYAGSYATYIQEALTEDPLPSLVVVASEHSARSHWVRREIATYLERTGKSGSALLPIQLTPGAAEALGIANFQVIDLADGGTFDESLVDRLWLALTGRLGARRLDANRDRAAAWCSELRTDGRPDFWGDNWRGYVYPLLDLANVSSRALIAPAGSGKSIIASRYIQEVLAADNKSMPVVLAELQMLASDDVASTVCRLVGVPSLRVLAAHAHRLAQRGNRIVFVVDGLDRAGREPKIVREFLEVLRRLAEAAPLLVTCRPEVWADAFADLGIPEVKIEALPFAQVRRVLGQDPRFRQVPDQELLGVPFFLDAALQAQYVMHDLPDNESALLAFLWRRYTQLVAQPIPEPSSPARVLQHLALLQLRGMTYSVPRAELDRALQDTGYDESTAISALLGIGVIVQHAWAGTNMVRLRHDLLDCFGIVNLLLDDVTGQARRREVYARAADDIGWAVLASLVQYVYDRGRAEILREVFTALLQMLDEKRLGDSQMARAWAATYVLRSKLSILLPQIIECLSGTPVPSVAEPQSPTGSRIGPHAKVTREAASSLASALCVVDDWTAAEPDSAIPMLAMTLRSGRWPRFRRRFIEALARYHRRDALDALEAFATTEIEKVRHKAGDADIDILADLADALASIGDLATSTPLLDGIVDVSRAVRTSTDRRRANRHVHVVAIRAERAANRAKTVLGGGVAEEVGFPASEDELLESLRPQEFGRNPSEIVYTDWRVVQWAVEEARRKAQSQGLNALLRDSVIESLEHEHTRVQAAAVRCLAWVDHEDAREAILAQLTKPYVAAEVRRECVAALRVQLSRPKSAVARAARRWVVLNALARATQSSPATAVDDLQELLHDPTLQGELLVSEHGFECLVTTKPELAAEIVLHGQPETSLAVRHVVTAADKRAVGVSLENKYRICQLGNGSQEPLVIALGEATWREGAAFHSAMRRLAQVAPEKVDGLLTEWLDDSAKLPGLASIHCIVVTADRQILLARRGSETPYAGGDWSATFEEQITDADLNHPPSDVVPAVVRRGFREEFGTQPSSLHVYVLGAVMEMPIMNPCIVCLLTVDSSYVEIRTAWETTQDRNKPAEIIDLDHLHSPTAVASKPSCRFHPTAQIRLDMLARWWGST
jgi:TIR domain/NACHT domain